ncbi:Isochorismatase hydrolase [Annulohypoxylon truncatum]|uniref:Isochorismatase hydrolase n=1 Tax=Annulohypoxylon truncatum TaxID=327061 RepID=UPI0020076EAA|nr:Isochorismatase hydrolase [Annulohypoxylon truncatum]KAI1213306.1 Isochorismatase hydrolase [Annulohypoxylon truncatum]
MRASQFSAIPLVLGGLANAFTYERLNKNDTLLLILDMQEGLISLARDYDPTVFRNALYAHAALGKAFDLPVVMTSSSQSGPNGPLPDEFLEWYPDAPLIMRQGEVDAWDNPQFREAVIAANKSQIIIGGITTDVCTTFLALSLREAGYAVFANHEASGTTSVDIRENANERMRAAGVQVLSYFAIFGELMRDWRNVPGAEQLMPVLDQYYPAYGMVARAHRAAVNNGTVLPGEDILP